MFMSTSPAAVIEFWKESGPSKWFKKDAHFDRAIIERFGRDVEHALVGDLDHWTETPSGALALVLLLDQFSRNIWRDSSEAFSGDEMAVAVAKRAIAKGWDMDLKEEERRWFYMPFMHSEDLGVQREGMRYFSDRLDDPGTLKFAQLHADIIERFGRFPHRNEVLGRLSRDEEIAYLAEGGFSG
jgi:uncharacterized protein (DUF924 family)